MPDERMRISGLPTSGITEDPLIEDNRRDAELTLRAPRQHQLAKYIVQVQAVGFESIVAVVHRLGRYRPLLKQAPTAGLSALAGPHAYAQ